MLTPMQFGYDVGLYANQGIKSGGWFGGGPPDDYRKEPGIPESAAQRRSYSGAPAPGIIGSVGRGISNVAQGVGNVAQGVGNVAQGIGNAVGSVGRGVGNVVQGVSNVAQGVGNVAQGIGNVAGSAIRGVDNVAQGIGYAAGGVSDVLGNLGHGVWKGASDTTFTPMQFGYDVGMHADQYMKSGSWLSQGVGNVASGIGNVAQGVGNVASGVGNAAASVGKGIGGGLASAGSWIAKNPGTTAWEGSKFIPGIGAIPSLIDAGSSLYKGNYLSALGHVAGAGINAIGGGAVAGLAKGVGGKLLASGATRMASGATNAAAGTAKGLFNTAAGGAQYAAGRTLEGAGKLMAAPAAYADDAIASMNKAVGTQAQKVVGPVVDSGYGAGNLPNLSTFKPMQAVKNQIGAKPVTTAAYGGLTLANPAETLKP